MFKQQQCPHIQLSSDVMLRHIMASCYWCLNNGSAHTFSCPVMWFCVTSWPAVTDVWTTAVPTHSAVQWCDATSHHGQLLLMFEQQQCPHIQLSSDVMLRHIMASCYWCLNNSSDHTLTFLIEFKTFPSYWKDINLIAALKYTFL
jgi:hypothetical protein